MVLLLYHPNVLEVLNIIRYLVHGLFLIMCFVFFFFLNVNRVPAFLIKFMHLILQLDAWGFLNSYVTSSSWFVWSYIKYILFLVFQFFPGGTLLRPSRAGLIEAADKGILMRSSKLSLCLGYVCASAECGRATSGQRGHFEVSSQLEVFQMTNNVNSALRPVWRLTCIDKLSGKRFFHLLSHAKVRIGKFQVSLNFPSFLGRLI